MLESLPDRAADILHRAARILVPAPELAHRLGVSTDELLAGLDGDPRFIVVHSAAFPDFTPLLETDRVAYDRALREAGVNLAPGILLAPAPDPPPDPGPGDRPGPPPRPAPRAPTPDLAGRLRRCATHLLAARAEPTLAAAADRLYGPLLGISGGTPPSTTPLPGPPAPAPDPPQPRRQ